MSRENSLRIILSLVVSLAAVAVNARGQQDPLDLGQPDSIIAILDQPYFSEGAWSTTVDVYLYNDAQRVVALSVGLAWDLPAMQLDSVRFTPEARNAFSLFRYTFYKDDIDSSNFYQLFQCTALGHPDSGLTASPSRKPIATYYFTLSQWLPGATACVAEDFFVDRALVDPDLGEYTVSADLSSCVLAGPDDDGDGIGDNSDNCPGLSNADQGDTDGDRIGDLCDQCTDSDDDGYGNPGFAANTCPEDNCPFAFNPGQEDADGDGIGDACEDGCCVGRVGDANGSGSDEPTIGDISTLVDMLFVTQNPDLVPCVAEGDANQSGGETPTREDITIGDISLLIDYLFVTGPSLGLPDCF